MKTTTISLGDDLMQAIVSEAGQAGQTPDQVIERVLREALLEGRPQKPFQFRWVTVAGEFQPGVDLDSRDSLIERMEGREDHLE